ncbi:lipopolysaccharide biosynthesis protein [Pontibacter fetidus]|uniref:Lipopolysaccharide biosynthesis protein n=1 Tax=Pontibacter fetidus TaxID=2700082 RepID=A0A6B2H8T1_9BACT|nr:lipopolysaccharide biosynthesis protein [Pontibacter fetidus]NDK55594.1 lipopolysaccharide biosynthesis protein [Pontibacter fetidus]
MEAGKLKGKIVSGLFWSTIQLLISRVFAFVIKLILARLLFPDQFGLVGMATVFISFIQILNDLGIGAALVQKKEENLTELHYHTAFWAGIAWSVVIYLLIAFVAAPLAAQFYKQPQLSTIIPVLGLGVLFNPINLVHRAQLTKQMSFKKLAFINNASSIVAGVAAVILALLGAGIWALVFNSVASTIIAVPLYFNATKWLPKFSWDKQAFNDVFSFGVYTMGTEFLTTLMLNFDYLLIGKLLSATALGVYTLAFVLTDTFRTQLTKMINRVMFPVYGQNQDSKSTLKNVYFKVVKYNSICVYPVMVFLIVLGEPFVVNYFGLKWVEAVIPLKILAFSVMIHLLVNSHSTLIRGLGKTNLEMRMQFLKAILYLPTIALGIYWYGIIGAASAYVINKVLEVVIAQFYLKKFLGIRFSDVISAISPPLTASVVAYVVTFVAYSYGVHYVVCAVLLGVSYSLVIWLMMKAELLKHLRSIKFLRKKTVAP